MYSFDSRVRYSEVDGQLRLTPCAMMNYLQDCSIFQSEDLHRGIRFLEKADRAWMLASWHIVIDRMPVLGERITVGTWPYGFKGIYGYRNFTICGVSGESLVRADSVWFLYDTAAGVPVRVSPEDIRGYGTGEEAPLPMPAAPRRIAVPQEYREGAPVTVARHHIDTNHHVNNAKYVEIAREAVPGDAQPVRIRAEYRRAARLGDVLTPRVSGQEDNAFTVALCGADGRPCALVWMQMREPGPRDGHADVTGRREND